MDSYRFKPPRGIVLTKDPDGFPGGHWVAFCRPDDGAEPYIADNNWQGLTPQSQYPAATISKIVAPAPSCTDEAVAGKIRRASLSPAER